MSVETLVKIAKENSGVGLGGASAGVAAGGLGAMAYANHTANGIKDRIASSQAKGSAYGKAFIRNGGTLKGTKNPFAAAKRLMNQNAKVTELGKSIGAGSKLSKISRGGKIAAGIGGAGLLAAGAKKLFSSGGDQ